MHEWTSESVHLLKWHGAGWNRVGRCLAMQLSHDGHEVKLLQARLDR